MSVSASAFPVPHRKFILTFMHRQEVRPELFRSTASGSTARSASRNLPKAKGAKTVGFVFPVRPVF
jgi:hypothetical protein